MDSMARSLISKSESYYLDLFLFCFYYGGMAPIDTAYPVMRLTPEQQFVCLCDFDLLELHSKDK